MAKARVRPREDYYCDDPVRPVLKPKNNRSFLSVVMLMVAGLFLNNTFAANISLTNGGNVEFGQGISMTTACSGSSALTVTPQTQFVNLSGSGSFYFSSVKVSGIPTSCHGVDFIINAYGASSNSPLPIFNTSSVSAVVYNNAGTFELGAGTTSGASISSASGAFTLTFTNPVATSASVSRLTIQSGSHATVETLCQQGITCSIGDVGPGGGNIFYTSVAGFSCGSGFTNTGGPTGGLCHYLEAAPSTWSSSTFRYAMSGLENSDVSGVTNETTENSASSAIGLGYKNSLAIISQGNDATSAAGAARAYSGGLKSDWYLPSFAELNQMCKWARGVAWTSDATICSGGTLNIGTGAGLGASGFQSNFYWSSSERESSNGWGVYFNTPAPDYLSKFHVRYVRPIRAF
jgi:hypothetical protein